ncbi:hypothetical protein LHYA1_G005531 [Lachnellula hyalina]|uniref:Tetraspanin Tsp3 n=1 Tax=Lachnellula hyalina TaxID=1316788 RepID=A0A8H8U0P0_9HELO|nr:uncharacterized protein LHYA1_G005531 [Lachnellula hyalina]TVY26216.1 hypothetical protein LHYA1_G005531 [Lachnellula hyalina]
MTVWEHVLLLAGPLLLLLLTAIAGWVALSVLVLPMKLPLTQANSYAYSQINYLNLPIPQALALFTIVLPLITGVSTQGVYSLIRQSTKNEQFRLTIPLIAVIGFQLIYETIVATLALTHMIPPNALSCELDHRWAKLFRNKDTRGIRTIQDTFECCGLNSVVDRAFPFGQPSTCATTYGRSHSCFGEWRRAEQVNAGLLFLVAVVVFALKVGSIFTLLSSASWTHLPLVRAFKRIGSFAQNGDEDARATMRRLIEGGSVEEPYLDDPEAARANENGNHGPRVQPSALGETSNEWADDDESGARDAQVSS